MRLWRNDHGAGSCRAASLASEPAGNEPRSVAALLNLRPAWPFRRSFPTDSTTKVSWDDHPRNPRTNSPLFLRRALENRHHCTSPERPPRHRTARHRSGTVPARRAAAAIHCRSVSALCAGDVGATSALARHAALPDDPGPRLFRQRRATATHRGPFAPATAGSLSAIAGVSSRAGTS
jgi:hypothetical protein